MLSLRSRIVSTLLSIAGALACGSPQAAPPTADQLERSVIIDHEVTTIDGKTVRLSDYRGKALLIVNTASECGYTPQYEGLEKLHQTYKDRGLLVLGFPSNEYGGQEPGSNEEIANFCTKNFGVTFPMFAKVVTKGAGIVPLFKALTEQSPEPMRGEIQWNFTKFLIDKEGRVVGRWASRVKPMDAALTSVIEAQLGG